MKTSMRHIPVAFLVYETKYDESHDDHWQKSVAICLTQEAAQAVVDEGPKNYSGGYNGEPRSESPVYKMEEVNLIGCGEPFLSVGNTTS